jgi:hypothetical protein
MIHKFKNGDEEAYITPTSTQQEVELKIEEELQYARDWVPELASIECYIWNKDVAAPFTYYRKVTP